MSVSQDLNDYIRHAEGIVSDRLMLHNQWKARCDEAFSDLRKDVGSAIDKHRGVEARIDRLNLDLFALKSACDKRATVVTDINGLVDACNSCITHLEESIADKYAVNEQKYRDFNRDLKDLGREVDELRLDFYGYASKSNQSTQSKSIYGKLRCWMIRPSVANFF